MRWIQLSLFQSRNLSVGFRQTAYLPLWRPVNCFGSSDECKCVSFNKFEFQRKTNNCFHILVHCQLAKWEKRFSLNVIPTFDGVPKRVRAACENKLILLKAFPSSIVATSVHRNTINDGCKSGANHSVQHRSVCLPEHTSFRLFNDCFAHTNLFIHMTKILSRFTRLSGHSLFNAVLLLNPPSPSSLYIFTRVSQSRPHQSHFFSLFRSVAMLFSGDWRPKASLQPVCSFPA